MPENNRFTHSNFDQVFGEQQNVYRVRRGCFEKFVVPSIVFGCLLFGVLIYVDSKDWLAIPVCVLPFFLMFCAVVWHLFTTRRDELRMYENGFTHNRGKNLQSCLWTEIKDCRLRERNDRDLKDLPDGIFPLGAVEKKNGEVIEFDSDLPGTPEIIARFELSKAKPGDKKNRRR